MSSSLASQGGGQGSPRPERALFSPYNVSLARFGLLIFYLFLQIRPLNSHLYNKFKQHEYNYCQTLFRHPVINA
jgi:hypothetical protein